MGVFISNFPFPLLLLIFGVGVQPVRSGGSAAFQERPQNQSVLIGSNVVLRCSAPASNTKFDLQSQWRTNKGILLGFYDSGTLPGYAGRYSYDRESPGELHLHLQNVSLEDDGNFECQMIRPPAKFLRSTAVVNVLVPPTQAYFQNYELGTVEIDEDSLLNITCVGGTAKPEVDVNLFLNGKKVNNNLQKWTNVYDNKTADSFISWSWKPSKNDHNKIVSCEVSQPETNTSLRNALALRVLYSSNRPKIDLLGAGDKLIAGQNITLLCSAEGGNPPPQLLWTNQVGRPINSTFQYDFTNQITRNAYNFIVNATDNGEVYECSSSNRENSAPLKKAIALSVEYPPQTVYIYGSTTVRKGENILISCSSGISSPSSVITWTINGASTRMQEQIEKRQTKGFVTESNLTINSNNLLSGQNQISVECKATNALGSSSIKQHIIRVLSPPSHPVIFEPEQNSALTEGTLLNLTCEAQGGHPLATLSWYRGVEKLKEAYSSSNGDSSRSIITIKLDRSMNQQQIRCDAENGATDSPLIAKKTLSVLFLPNHMKIRQLETANHYQMIADLPSRLSCNVASSNPPAEINWEFENKVTKKVVSKSGQYTKKGASYIGEYKGFEVENVIQFIPSEEMDKSNVRCVASHPQWSESKASSFTLDVIYPPRVAVKGPISIVVGEGESFEENLTVFSNPHVTNYQWRKNGIAIDRMAGSIYVKESVIGGTDVYRDDSGIYTLLVANRIGTANVSIKVLVEYPAYINYITSPVIAGVGEDVVLECEAEGVPLKNGMVKWFRGNNELKSIVQDKKRSVLRLNASHENSGTYTCVADNGVGRPNYTTAYLLVRRPPIIIRSPEFDRAAGHLGGTATLRCRAVGVPNVDFNWSLEGDGQMFNYNTSKYKFFDTKLDHSTFQGSLMIMKLDERDYTRRIRCMAKNQLGTAQTFITVGPPTPPDIPMDLELLNVTDKTASLSWQPGFNGGSEQIFEIRIQENGQSDYKTINSSYSRILLTDLKTEQTYRIQIRSINANGRYSDYSSPPLQFRTLDENLRGVYKVAAENMTYGISNMTLFWGISLIILVLLNLILVYCCKQKQKRKKLQENSEKTEIARTLNQQIDGSGRPIQIYGSMVGTPATNRRPDSTNTNKSDLLNEPVSEIDNQSVRTMIEVNPNGFMVNQMNGNLVEFYDSNGDSHCIVDYDTNQDCYSTIHKPLLANGTTYASVPYPEPPYNLNASNSMLHYPNGTSSLHRRQQHLIQQQNVPNNANFMYENNQPYGTTYLLNPNSANGDTLTRNQHRSPRMMSTFVQHQQPPQTTMIIGAYGSDDPNEGELV